MGKYLIVLFALISSRAWPCRLETRVRFVPESTVASEILSTLKPTIDNSGQEVIIAGDPTHVNKQVGATSYYPVGVDSLSSYMSILSILTPYLIGCEEPLNQLIDRAKDQTQILRASKRVPVKIHIYTEDSRLLKTNTLLNQIFKNYANPIAMKDLLGDETTRLQYRLQINEQVSAIQIDFEGGQAGLGNFNVSLSKVPSTITEVNSISSAIATFVRDDLPISLQLSAQGYYLQSWASSALSFSTDRFIKKSAIIYLPIFTLILLFFFLRKRTKCRINLKEESL